MYHAPQSLAPRTGPINRSVAMCYDCSAASGERHTNICDLSPAVFGSEPRAFAPWLGSADFTENLMREQVLRIPETSYARRCDECGRTWEGALPTPEVVHVWLCPWCETRLFGRDVTWQQQPNDTWVNTHAEVFTSSEYPWRGPLRVIKEGGNA